MRSRSLQRLFLSTGTMASQSAGEPVAGAMPAMMAVTAPRAASAVRAADRSRTPPSRQLVQRHAGSSRQHQQELNSEVEAADRAESELKADVKVNPGGIGEAALGSRAE